MVLISVLSRYLVWGFMWLVWFAGRREFSFLALAEDEVQPPPI